jgi:hypothetical protein
MPLCELRSSAQISRSESLRPKLAKTQRVMPLRQARPGIIGNQRAMMESWYWQVQCSVNQYLPGGRE